MSGLDSKQVSATEGFRARGRALGMALAMTASLALTGCSSVPDAVNPVEWYRGVQGWWSDDDQQEADRKAAEGKPIPGEGKPFPKLDSVPGKPRISTEADRKAAAGQLAADRDQARYTDQQVRLQTDDRPAPPPEPPPPPAPSSSGPRSSAPSSSELPPAAAPAPSGPATQQPPPPAMSSSEVASPPAPPRMAPSPPPVAQVTPPPMEAPAPAGQSNAVPAPGGTAQAPGGSMPFGAPPPDIAAMDGAAPSAGDAAAPAPPASNGAAGYRPTRSPFSPRFPAGVETGAAPPPPAANEFAGYAGYTPYGSAVEGGTPIATVTFAVGSSRIDAAGRRAIRAAAQQQKARGGMLQVIGHASSRTRDLSPVRHHMVNFRVSVDRASAVARELVRQGAAPGSIQVTAVSDSEPAFFEVMPAGEAGNRRAVIVLGN
jgi:outer membrane protein OmpA-like peptidoglycan-associated protein